jgi:hypothetical protein
LPGPSDKLPVAPESTVEVKHLEVGCANGAGVTGTESGLTAGAGLAEGTVLDELYVASKPAAFTDSSDEKTTVNWPVGDVTVTSDLVPVRDVSSGASNEEPP